MSPTRASLRALRPIRRASAAVALGALATGPGCGGSERPDALLGVYDTQRSVLVTGVLMQDTGGDPSDCGAPQFPSASTGSYGLIVENGRHAIADLGLTCVLRASFELGDWVADGERCDIDMSLPLKGLGVLQRDYAVLRLNPSLGTVAARVTSSYESTTGTMRTCSVLDERIVDPERSPPPEVIAYDVATTHSVEVPGEGAPCGAEGTSSRTSAFLLLDDAASPSSIYFEGLGCRLPVRAGADGALEASDRECRPAGRIGATDIGIHRIVFERFVLDLAANAIAASGWMARSRSDGPLTSCFTFNGQAQRAL